MELDPLEYKEAMHRIITTIVAPRPIGWISTRSDGRDNLAPFSYYNIVSTYPPAVMFSPGLRNGEPKDSQRMADKSGEFVANLVTEDLIETMDLTSASLVDESEFDYFDVERAEAVTVDAPRVADAAACLECSVIDTVDVHDNTLVIGDVEHIYIHERLTVDGVVDMRKVDSVGRIGGPWYSGIDILDVERKGFGAWIDPIPPGFTVDEATKWLQVDEREFERVREALCRLEAGDEPSAVADEFGFDQEELAAFQERDDLYLNGITDDERIEFALSEAGLDSGMSY